MKKILILLATLLLLSGCGKAGYSTISNSDDVIFKSEDTTFTKEDLYKVIKISSEDAVIEDILIAIADTYDFDLSQLETDAQTNYDYYAEMGLESYLISYYGSKDGFFKQYTYSGILDKLTQQYIDDNIDEFLSTDTPVQMQYAYFPDLETAQKFVEEINNATTFDTAAANNGYETSTQAIVYLGDENLPDEVKNYLSSTTVLGLSTIIETSTNSEDADGNIVTDKQYYVLNVFDKDLNNFKEDYLLRKTEDVDQEDMIQYMLETHDIEFFDQDLYEVMSSKYEVLK